MDPIFIPIAAMAIPLVVVPTAIISKHLQRKREWEHLERIKALELGQPIPGSESWHAMSCASIGAGVPLGSMFLAWVATVSGSGGEEVWACATAIGITGVICGTILAKSRLGSRRPASTDAHAKPEFDPDAYDVVGRRG
jgi:hypothetical protein